jgi:hypothetical protein
MSNSNYGVQLFSIPDDGYASDSVQKLKTKEVKVAGIGEVKNIKADDGVSRAISVV